MSLEAKVVLVTGGSSGIGRAAAHAFAAARARVVLAARGVERGDTVARDIRSQGGEARFVQADVSRAEDVERLLAQTIAAYGRLDAAFNNAATEDGAFALTADFSEEQFDLVNTSSVNGLGGASGGSLYSAAKAGLLALTKSAAQEYATQGIRVNALVAGAFRTPMLERVFDFAGGSTAEGRTLVEQQYAALVPMRRIGRPEEAAAVAVWLCSDAASYVTGHSMIVDGGMTAFAR
jgi:NAD(P)-dependent dehydrogenase (short-subunit alcohol dehydrogenase family)